MALKLCEVLYFSHDFDAAVRWYSEVLGIRLKGRYDWGFAEFDIAGVQFGLMQREVWQDEGLATEALPAPRLSLQVDDLEAEVARLKAAGADVDQVTGEPGTMRGVDLRDGLGNHLFLWEAPEG